MTYVQFVLCCCGVQSVLCCRQGRVGALCGAGGVRRLHELQGRGEQDGVHVQQEVRRQTGQVVRYVARCNYCTISLLTTPSVS